MTRRIEHFSFPVPIDFGWGALNRLPESLNSMGVKKPLVVTDSGLKKTEIYENLKTVLNASKIPFAVFSDVSPNPKEKDVARAAKCFVAEACDSVVGFGGGSPLDVAKGVRVMVTHEGPLTDYDVQKKDGPCINEPLQPFVAIPTTAGTGSEVGSCSVISRNDSRQKFLVCSPFMKPSLALLDPGLTVGLPPFLTAYTGMDAFSHSVEALAVDAFHPMCDALALAGIERVAKYLERAVKTPDDREAREQMMIAAMLGAVAFQKDLGAAHALAHALSSVYDMHHGLANALCIAAVMRYNLKVCPDKYARVAACFNVEYLTLPNEEAAEKAVEEVMALNSRIDIPKGLSSAGVEAWRLPELAEIALVDICHRTNPRSCSKESLLSLLNASM